MLTGGAKTVTDEQVVGIDNPDTYRVGWDEASGRMWTMHLGYSFAPQNDLYPEADLRLHLRFPNGLILCLQLIDKNDQPEQMADAEASFWLVSVPAGVVLVDVAARLSHVAVQILPRCG